MDAERILMALVGQLEEITTLEEQIKELETGKRMWSELSWEKTDENKQLREENAKLKTQIDGLNDAIDRYNIQAQESICKDGAKNE